MAYYSSPRMARGDRRFAEKLVSEVQKKPILYDSKHPDHRDRTRVDEEWLEVGKAMGVPWEAAKRRWQNLRGSFSKSLQYQLQQQMPGAESKKSTKNSRFYLYHQMLFLLPHMSIVAEQVSGNSLNELQDIEEGMVETEQTKGTTHLMKKYLEDIETLQKYSSAQSRKELQEEDAETKQTSSYSTKQPEDELLELEVEEGEEVDTKPFTRDSVTQGVDTEHHVGSSSTSFWPSSNTMPPYSSITSSQPRPRKRKEPPLDGDDDIVWEFLKGLVPQIRGLSKRRQRKLFRVITNELFNLHEEQEDAESQ